MQAVVSAIPFGAFCPWPQLLKKFKTRVKSHRNRIRVRVRSFVDGRTLRFCSETEARILCGENADGSDMLGPDGRVIESKARRLSRLKAPLTDIKLRAPERGEKGSPCTLTKGDMLANADGSFNPDLRKGSAKKIGNYVDRAMSKVEAWPHVHDDRNTVIAAGVAYGVFCPWPQVRERVVTFA